MQYLLRALRASPAVLALLSVAPSLRAELPPPPSADAPSVPDRGALLGFSISAYLLAPARCLGAFASHGVACDMPRGLRIDEPHVDPSAVASVVLPAFARRLTFARFLELGGFDVPRTDLPVDLGAVALALAARMRLRWVLAGMVHTRGLAPAEGPHGIAFHPVFGTVTGGATVGIVAAF